MDGHRNLEGEIESLLAVEPSPEFLARVRTRVAEEPEPGGWRLSWLLGVASTAVAIALVVMVWPSADLNPSNAPSLERPRVADVAEAIMPPAMPAPQIQTKPSRSVAAAVAATRERAIDIDLPEVMIAENEATTFASLVARVRQQRFDAVVPAAPDPDTPLEIRELPPVEPLEIEPIVRVAALQAEGERP